MGGLGAEQVKSGRNTSHSGMRRLIPGTSVVLALLVASVILNYVDRINLSIAAPMLKDELKISAEQLGCISGGVLLIAVVQAPRGAYVVLLLMLGVAFGMCSSNVHVITQRLAGQQAVGR